MKHAKSLSEFSWPSEYTRLYLIVGHPEPEKKNSVGIFEYILASMLKVYLDMF